ncbi:glycosyltransferase family 10 [Chitinophaga pollutisoli]|uniref:Glycosyltransferase family 10 n=1 Tax=Chitinophaga pollutisoli TaxID=3133966 RepID=A0ABZ2YJS4_9BACT
MTIRDLLIYTGLYRPYVNYKFLPDENNIEVLNFYPTNLQELWHYRYVMHHFRDLVTPDNTLLIGSVFGPKRKLKLSKSHIKMFYTGENVKRFPDFLDQCKKFADIAIAFDYADTDQYQRFPIWLEYFFEPDSTPASIRKELAEFVTNYCPDNERKFASLVCSHDKGKLRTILFHAMSTIDRVDSGGRYLNNTNALQDEFQDDKARFIGQYKFNICPENTDREGYVTEKVFQAIRSNTIPVYWGGLNNPEPEVLNKDAILFYNGPDSMPGLLKQIEELHRNPKLFSEFLAQPKFQPHADEYIIHLFDSLHRKMKKVLTKKGGVIVP